MRILKGTELRGKSVKVPGAQLSPAPPNIIPDSAPVSFPKYFVKQVPPTIHDDVSIGAVIFSEWLVQPDNTIYICANPARDNATWLLVHTTAF